MCSTRPKATSWRKQRSLGCTPARGKAPRRRNGEPGW
jgi:hypothetical protein